MDGSWFKLYRKLGEWEWHDSPEMVTMWIHLLIFANVKETKWHGQVIGRGQMATSLQKLASLTGLSVRQVRTCLARLEESGCVTSEATNSHRVITICNFERYQDSADSERQTLRQANDKQATSKRQTQIIRIIEGENKKEILSKDNKEKENEFGEYQTAMETWLAYKKDRRESYKNERSISACLSKLKALSGGDPERAMRIVNQSMANNWAGLFELREDPPAFGREHIETKRFTQF